MIENMNKRLAKIACGIADEHPECIEPINGAIYDALVAEERDPLIALVAELTYCTGVLGNGVGKITVPDGFFRRWNEAEAKAQALLRDRRSPA